MAPQPRPRCRQWRRGLFSGTRFMVSIQFYHLGEGKTLDEFLASYPSVSRDQAVTLLRLVGQDFNDRWGTLDRRD